MHLSGHSSITFQTHTKVLLPGTQKLIWNHPPPTIEHWLVMGHLCLNRVQHNIFITMIVMPRVGFSDVEVQAHCFLNFLRLKV